MEENCVSEHSEIPPSASKSATPCLLRLQKVIFSTLENDPLFARPCGGDLSMEKYRELSFLRYRRVLEHDFLSMQDMITSPLQMSTFISCLGMYDWSLATKFFLSVLVSR